MSRETTRRSLRSLNTELQKRYDQGKRVYVDIDGKPDLRITSFDPLAYEEYGTPAPRVAGSLVLRALLSAPHPEHEDEMIVFAGVEAGSHAYGFAIDGDDPDHLRTLVNIAEKLGHHGVA